MSTQNPSRHKKVRQPKKKKDQNVLADFLTCTSLFARQRKPAAEKQRNEQQ
jgi:hypothetical protein